MKLPNINYSKVLTVILVVGCVLHPASSAVGLCLILAHQLADKYFTSNISDKDRAELAQLKTEVAEIKVTQQATNLAKAFGPR